MKLHQVVLMGGVCCMVLSVKAFEDLGTVDKARAEHPNIFVPGEVNTLEIGGVRNYVYSGVAERYLDDETDSELWQEATFDAKKTLFQKLSEGKDDVEVSVSGGAPLYQVKDGRQFMIILAAPEENVIVRRKSTPAKAAVTKPADQTVQQKPPAAALAPDCSPSGKGPDPEVAKLSDVALRDYVAEHQEDWRARRLLGERTIESGKRQRGAKHLDIALRTALSCGGVAQDELADFAFETALRCEDVEFNALALKYYRMVLHLKSTPDMRKYSNARVGLLLLHN